MFLEKLQTDGYILFFTLLAYFIKYKTKVLVKMQFLKINISSRTSKQIRKTTIKDLNETLEKIADKIPTTHLPQHAKMSRK